MGLLMDIKSTNALCYFSPASKTSMIVDHGLIANIVGIDRSEGEHIYDVLQLPLSGGARVGRISE
jgi:hypothetical protein